MSQINETAIKSPGVYTTEIPLFPPSVAQVATAIPAFIGYTERATRNGKNVVNQAVRISSLVQYVQYFGDAFDNLSATVVLNNDNSISSTNISPRYQMFNAIQMFFNHGGANCYIISVGLYNPDGSAAITDFINPGSVRCFDVLRKEDEPTLIVVPDAVLLDEPDFNTVMTAALKQCGDLQDRFTILDVLHGDQERSFDNDDVVTKFRNGIGGSNLNYGAAYYPWLRTSLQYKITYANTHIEKPAGNPIALSDVVNSNSFLTQLDLSVNDLANIITPFTDTINAGMANLVSKADLENRIEEIKDMLTGFTGLSGFTDTSTDANKLTTEKKFDEYILAGTGGVFTPVEKLMRELILINDSYPLPTVSTPNDLGKVAPGDFDSSYQLTGIVADDSIYGNTAPADDAAAVQHIRSRMTALYANVRNHITAFLHDVQNMNEGLEQSLVSSSAIYANAKTAIKREGIIVPPSGAVAGVYAVVDGTRGVWKAPANVSLNTVIEPMVNIDNNIQDDLNVDVNAGKSINAIRTFSGKGTLVWGARTLAGNDNEWRYISVRRFFIMVEESAKKATAPFVFEPNDANTWVKVRGMLENYLTVLWRQGALAGAKPEHAFFVKCGLGQTMTADDILEGRLIIEIGMAAVRPAEFIILRFSHKLQES